MGGFLLADGKEPDAMRPQRLDTINAIANGTPKLIELLDQNGIKAPPAGILHKPIQLGPAGLCYQKNRVVRTRLDQ